MNHANKFRHLPIAAAVFAALQAAAAHADTDAAAAPKELPRISVEGQEDTNVYKADRAESPKFTEPLLETPQTVTIIPKEVIAQQGAASLTDTLRNVPGITFQLGENGNTQSGDTIFMRGFDTQNSIFLDGIRDLGAAVRDVFNVEQIEIFKGPAGADNGRGATSGYVNLASKVPTARDALVSSVAYGTSDRRRITGDWNHALDSVDGAAFRLNVMGQQGGVAGRDYLDRDSWGIAPSFALGLGTATRFYAYSQHVRQDNVPDGAVPTIGVADYKLAALDSAGIPQRAVRDANFYGLTSDFEDIKADMVTARFEHDFAPDITLRNTSRYGKSEQERVLTAPLQAPIVVDGTVVRTDPSTWTLGRTRHASFRDNTIITNQTNVTAKFATGSIQHSLSTGVEYIFEKQFTPTMGGLGTLAPTNLFNPDRTGVFTVAPALARTGAYSDGHTATGAVYAFDTWELTSRWQLSTGLRWEHFKTQTRAAAVTGTTITATRLDQSDSLLSWKTGVLFKPAENGSVYVAFANSLKPPGADNFTLNAAPGNNGAVNTANPNLEPQKATNVEIGTKWDLLEGRLAATAALFKSRNKNDLARTDPGDPDSIVQYGEKEVKGLELGLVGQLTDAWQISAGLTRQDTEVKEGTFGGTQSGAVINFSPRFSATMWTTYRLPMGLTVGGGVRHVDTSARSVSNVPVTMGVFEVPSFTVVDLFAAYDVNENVGVQLNSYNITDEDYVSAINNSGQRYIAGIPRSYLLTVNFRF
jgi:catecholate siderophore receptor